MLVAGTVTLSVRNWASWSDRPFIMAYVGGELSLIISTKILSILSSSSSIYCEANYMLLIMSLFF
jgi:hypothetical protein